MESTQSKWMVLLPVGAGAIVLGLFVAILVWGWHGFPGPVTADGAAVALVTCDSTDPVSVEIDGRTLWAACPDGRGTYRLYVSESGALVAGKP